MGKLSELDGVNRMLRAAQENPVSTLIASGVADTDLARAVLSDTRVMALMEGFEFNTERITWHPDSNDEILVGDNILHVDSSGVDYFRNIVLRTGKLYDKDNNQFTFPASLRVDVVYDFVFSDIPTAIQYQIVDEAARIYQQTSNADPQLDAYLGLQEQKSRAKGQASDIRTADTNILANTRVGRMLTQRGRGL